MTAKYLKHVQVVTYKDFSGRDSCLLIKIMFPCCILLSYACFTCNEHSKKTVRVRKVENFRRRKVPVEISC